MISRDQVREFVIESIEEALDHKDHVEITEATDPILELGLESHDGLDFACAISEKLQYSIPHRVNPFVDDKGKRALRVGEIVDLVCKLVEQNRDNDNG